MAASENTLSDLFNSWKGYGKELEAMIIDEEEEAEMDVTSDINNEVWIKVEKSHFQKYLKLGMNMEKNCKRNVIMTQSIMSITVSNAKSLFLIS